MRRRLSTLSKTQYSSIDCENHAQKCRKSTSLLFLLLLSLSYAENRPVIDNCYLTQIPTGVPPATHSKCDDPKAYGNVSYTLWTARQEGMAIALSNSTFVTPIPIDSGKKGKVFYPHWKIRSGFKAGFGSFVGHDGWDLAAQYTWFCNEDNHFSSSPISNGEIFPTWIWDGRIPNVDQAQSKWNSYFNRVDVTLGRAFYLGRTFTMRPFLGLLGTFEKQWLTNRYSNSSPLPFLVKEKNRQKWWSIGPYLGCNHSFIYYRINATEWSLFLNSGCGLPWGNYKTNNRTVIQISPSAVDGFLSSSNSFWNLTPMLELSLGLRVETFYSTCYKWSSLAQIAWEGQVWLGHNQMALLNFLRDGNNYSLQGLTITFQLSF